MTRKLAPGNLIAATHNSGKVKELKALFEPLGFQVRSAIELDLEEPEETEKTFAGNAALKALAAARTTGEPALSDDSGLEVFALDGQPGSEQVDRYFVKPSDTLSAGDYQVRWRGLSDDGHMMSDGFNFSVEP